MAVIGTLSATGSPLMASSIVGSYIFLLELFNKDYMAVNISNHKNANLSDKTQDNKQSKNK